MNYRLVSKPPRPSGWADLMPTYGSRSWFLKIKVSEINRVQVMYQFGDFTYWYCYNFFTWRWKCTTSRVNLKNLSSANVSARGRSLFIESDSNKIYVIVATQFEQQTNLIIIITWNILPEKRSIATQINSRLSFWNFGHDINNRCQAWPSDTLCGVWLFWSPTKLYMAILQYNSATRTAMLISAGKTSVLVKIIQTQFTWWLCWR